ncbi:XRE family transcriptional regulator [Skermanella aerolata]|uniref:XRE family transcriptional regulator n=1 Tax=Skermanella aerolata TaxID=393310 RepID=A0A512E565_9PROT|nr:XRE family transcriptional regulator [Skermanella aerolata]
MLKSATGRMREQNLAVTLAPDVLKTLSPKVDTVQKIAEVLGRVIRRSEKSGQADGFTFKVDAAGNYKIEPLAGIEQVQTASDDTDQIERAFDAARARGRIRAAQILDQEDMLNADAFAERLGVSRVTVNARRQKHELLGLDGAKRGYRFPAWQVDEDGKAFEALPRLFEILGSSPWGVYRFLTQRHNALRGSTAKDALRRGDTVRVLDVAESLARGDFA